MRKYVAFLILVFAFCAYSQSKDIKDGVGVGDIVVWKSTKKDVAKSFGDDFVWTKNKKYSFQMTYKELGVAFYICQSDKKQRVFVIEIKRPFKGKTSRGIEIGTSTEKDVLKLYGSGSKKYKGKEYRGIEFYYTPTKKGKIVTAVDVYEKSGIRQCKVEKAK